jgi:polyphosphate kinase 2 (PPK2 family)
VDDGVLARHYKYDDYKAASKQMFKETDVVDGAHWQEIDTTKFLPATAKILKSLVSLLRNKVDKRKSGIKFVRNIPNTDLPKFKHAPSLRKVDTSLSLGKEDYREKLVVRQKRIHELHNELYRLRIPMVIVYEGWDAAGKGGNIRRLTEEMDPRGYEVIPISAPNDVEKVHHYLWRFWTEFPKAGHLTIFDRSWYGRVLVERVEGFCSENDWKQAYREINEMEENFHHFNSVVVKFWVHIDKEEQLKRFEARQENQAKQWKLHEEDWRNREKWKPYEEAAEEMFLRTHTEYAPWTVIEGNCKRYARIKAMDVVIQAIEKKIEEKA